MANQTMRIQEIVDLLMVNTGQNMSEDIMYQWFEELYKLIRGEKWSWNYIWEGRGTLAPSTLSDSYKWTGVKGNNFITLDGGGDIGGEVVTIPTDVWSWKMTGRVFLLDNRVYKTVNSGAAPLTSPNENRLYLDKPMHVGFTSQKVEFTRQDYSFRTSSIKTVEVDLLKKASSLNDDYIRDFMTTRYWSESGAPVSWRVDDNKSLPSPKFAPKVKAASVLADKTSGGMDAGSYYLFWTYVDQESGLISAPGPTTTYFAPSDGTWVEWEYGNANIGEHTYGLRLWRSEKNPERSRVPMFAVNGPEYKDRIGVYGLDQQVDYMWGLGNGGDKDPTNSGDFVTDQLSSVNLRTREMYYDGPWTTVDLLPPPDDFYSFDVYRLNDWGLRPDGQSYVDLGRTNQVLELLRLGVHQFVELQNRDTSSFRDAIVQFRSQLMYLLKQDRTAASEDPGVGRHRDYKVIQNVDDYDPTKYWHWKS